MDDNRIIADGLNSLVPEWMNAICRRFADTLNGIPRMDHTARNVILNPDTLRGVLMQSYNERSALVGTFYWNHKETLEGIGRAVAFAHLFEASKIIDIPQPFHSSTPSPDAVDSNAVVALRFDDSRAKRFLRSTLHTLQQHPAVDEYLQQVYSYVNEQLRICTTVPVDPWLDGSQLQHALSSVSLLRFACNRRTEMGRMSPSSHTIERGIRI